MPKPNEQIDWQFIFFIYFLPERQIIHRKVRDLLLFLQNLLRVLCIWWFFDYYEFLEVVIKTREKIMRKEYGFSNAQKNPYTEKLRQQITISVDEDVVDYFKAQSEENGIPYQTLINLYLKDCAKNKRELQMSWQ